MSDRPGEWVVIDLGTAHGTVEDDRAPTARLRRRSKRRRLAVAAALLVLVCGGAATASPPFRPTAAVPVEPGSSVSVAGDLLVVADPAPSPAPAGGGSGGAAVLTELRGYDLPAGTERWRLRLPAAMSQYATRVGDLVLVASRDSIRRQTGTTAVDAGTGAVRWSRADAVLTAPGVAAGLAVDEVRSASGAGRRVSGRVDAIDLATGRSLWHQRVPSTAVAHVLGGDPPVAVLVLDSGRTEVRDLASGALRGAGTLPPADYAPDNPRLTEHGFVLRHPDIRPGRRSALSAYDLDDVNLRWSRPDRADEVEWADCAGDLCGRTPDGIWTLDLDSGGQVFATGDGLPWLPVRGSADELVLRLLPDERVAVADGGTSTTPRAIGTLPAGSRDCRVGDTALVCRGADGRQLAIFTLPRT
ncbi:PQQ-like domain-containing protein [Asanoa hainanensis]|uniref:PQQ-like domain-containing protein n=1 Tax=Asanoa hainanensis TaxID=560556 RepID=A0A239LSK8_9ACTN|nr:PQQ-binding-like beta-propeller repeat protein [Asanoa hainanensis]SNT32624.1 PQQ-like domain-containing protein [Asanoa hainanensis]